MEILNLYSRKTPLYLTLLGLILFLISSHVLAEGTEQVMPTAANGVALYSDNVNGTGPRLGAPQNERIRFDISDNTVENLYFGGNFYDRNPIVQRTDVYIRITDAAGTVVYGPQLYPTVGAGYIPNYAQAVAGPNISGTNPAGYTPLVFNPTANGDYYIEVYASANGGATMLVDYVVGVLFDFTVGETTGTIYPGRVSCQKWDFLTYNPATFAGSIDYSFDGDFYSYTEDSTVLLVNFNSGFYPFGYELAMTKYGINNTGDFINDRISTVNTGSSPNFANGFLVFLNEPDPNIFIRSNLSSTPALTNDIYGCPGAYFIPFYISDPGDFVLLLDLNGNPGYQQGTADRYFELFDSPSGNHVISWDGLDGLGAVVTGGTSINLQASLFRGRTNLPMFDAEQNRNGISVTAISPSTGNRKLYWDDSFLTNFGTCGSLATDNTTGAGVAETPLLGGIAGPSHAWNGTGAGYTIPAPTVGDGSTTGATCDDFGNARTINTWFYSFDVSSGIVAKILPTCDNDNDGILDPIDIDDDNDGILDIDEDGSDALLDADGDGIPNYLDADFAGFVDANNDGVNDNFDLDNDGIINSFDSDADGDGCSDVTEAGYTDASPIDGYVDGTGINPNGTVSGSDGYGTPLDVNPANGTDDYLEAGSILPNTGPDQFISTNSTVMAANAPSVGTGTWTLISGIGTIVDVNSPTSSIIALTQGANIFRWTFTNGTCTSYDDIIITVDINDFDGDGIPDSIDLDDDNDGILDSQEFCGDNVSTFSCLTADPNLDSDGDGIINYQDPDFAAANGTTLNGAGVLSSLDTDGDGIIDSYDLDSDNDGCFDVIEAGNTDSDFDGILGDTPTIVDANGQVTGTNVVDGYIGTNANVTTVNPVSNAGTDGTVVICPGSTVTQAQLESAITGEDTGGIWQEAFGGAGTYHYVVTSLGGCTDTSLVTVTYATTDSDGDGYPDLCDLDDDNDGILDFVELGYSVEGTSLGVADSIPCGQRFYQVINTPSLGQLYLLNVVDGSYIEIGSPAAFTYNGIGFNETDGFIYGTAQEAGTDALGNTIANKDLIKIDADGEVFRVAATAITGNNNAGDCYNNTLWSRDGNQIVQINLTTGATIQSVTPIPTLTGEILIADGVVYRWLDNGGVPTLYYGTLPASGGGMLTLSQTVISGAPAGSKGSGAAFTSIDPTTGNYILHWPENGSGDVYEIVGIGTSSVSASIVGGSAVSNTNDGAACPSGVNPYILIDTDNDGTPDYLDTDSDDDGCPDAVEAAGSFTQNDVDGSLQLTGGVDGNGIPSVTSGGQATTANVTTSNPAPNAGTDGTIVICTGSTVTQAQLEVAITGEDTGGTWQEAFAGTGIYHYVIISVGGCTDTSEVVVSEQAQPIAGTTTPFTICAGSTVTLAELNGSLSGADAGGTWSPALAGGGTYTYTVAATSPCTVNATVTVLVSEQAQPISGTTTAFSICAGSTVTLAELNGSLSGADAGGTWSPALAGGGTYTYTVVATSPCIVNATVTVVVSEQAQAIAGTTTPFTICAGSTVTLAELNGSLSGADTGGTWSPALAGGGTYTYTAGAISPCTVDATVTVVVSEQATTTIANAGPAQTVFATSATLAG
ncbi:MAG: hypothetical protein HRT58_19270, partial [Crocinitomicaceae bacterium]|nr:MSCRAMM family adhesin SdrC [Flavobacteriales bacterium]NQZ37812.1 hypothetical protein [Crocinitomicaceae bacterium]